jgi:hypothetical protein
VKIKGKIYEDILRGLETMMLSPQRNMNCLVLQVCIWNVNVRNVENNGCGTIYVGIFS